MDLSPRDHQSSTCVICTLSDRDRMAHLTPHGNMRNARSSSTIEIPHHPRRSACRHIDANGASDFHQMHGYDSPHDLHQAVAIKRWTHLMIGRTGSRDRDRPLTGSAIGQCRQDVEEPTIVVQSSRDRAAIAARSSRDRTSLVVESSPIDRQAIDEGSGPRSWPDRGAIVARSWRKSWLFGRQIQAKLTPIRCGIEATIYAHGIAPSTPSNRLHDRLHRPRFSSPISLLKKPCILLLFFNF